MKALDIIILIPLLWGAYKGFSKGLLVELSTILAFILATVLGFKLIDVVIQYIRDYIGENSFLPVIAFLTTFIGILLGVTLFAKAVKKALDLTLFGNLDDIAGAIVGILKWSFIISIFLWLLSAGNLALPESITAETVLFPYFVKFGPFIVDQVASLVPLTKDLISSIKEYL